MAGLGQFFPAAQISITVRRHGGLYFWRGLVGSYCRGIYGPGPRVQDLACDGAVSVGHAVDLACGFQADRAGDDVVWGQARPERGRQSP
jgi:hypothetical protein